MPDDPPHLVVPWLGLALGHGRASETVFSMIHAITGVALLCAPGRDLLSSPITFGIAWQGYGRLVAVPFLLAGAVEGSGVWLNIAGYPTSWLVRWCGALLGLLIWAWYGSMFALLVVYPLPGLPLEVTAAGAMALATSVTGGLFSFRIMTIAWAELPVAGAPGRY